VNVGGSIQNACNLALTGCCKLSGCCHCKNVDKTLQNSMQEVVSGAARLSMLSHDSCRRRTSEMKACESEVVKSHFHSEVELQVETNFSQHGMQDD